MDCRSRGVCDVLGYRRGGLGDRKPDAHGRAFPDAALDPHLAPGLAGESRHHAEPESTALAGRFGGEEGFAHAFEDVRGDAAPRVLDRDLDGVVTGSRGRDADPTAAIQGIGALMTRFMSAFSSCPGSTRARGGSGASTALSSAPSATVTSSRSSMPPTSALMSRISGASRWRREKAGEIADFVPPIQRIHPRLERSGDVAACRYQVLRRLDGPKLLLAQSEDAVGLKLELQVGDRLCELRAQSRRDPREQIRKLTAGALEGVTEHAHLIEARRLGSEQQVAEGRACQPLRIQWRSLGAGSVRSITAATPARVSNHEVSVFADDDTILAARQRGDVGIPRPILLGGLVHYPGHRHQAATGIR